MCQNIKEIQKGQEGILSFLLQYVPWLSFCPVGDTSVMLNLIYFCSQVVKHFKFFKPWSSFDLTWECPCSNCGWLWSSYNLDSSKLAVLSFIASPLLILSLVFIFTWSFLVSCPTHSQFYSFLIITIFLVLWEFVVNWPALGSMLPMLLETPTGHPHRSLCVSFCSFSNFVIIFNTVPKDFDTCPGLQRDNLALLVTLILYVCFIFLCNGSQQAVAPF